MTIDRKMKLVEALFRALTWAPARLPDQAAYALGAWGAGAVGRLWRSRFRFAVNNIKKSVELGALDPPASPEILAVESFRNLGRAAVEMIKIFHGLGEPLFRRVEIHGVENYEQAQAQGRGVMVITGHCGNWELMSLVFARRFGPNSLVARPMNNRYMNQLLEKARSIGGNSVIYKEGAVRKLLVELKKQKSVGLLMDQAVLKDESCVTSFLGRPALTSKLPALIARKTGVPVLPIFIHREKNGRHTMVIHPELALSSREDKEAALQEDTQNFSDYIEGYIRRHPSQWLWGHRRWKRAPDRMPELNKGDEPG